MSILFKLATLVYSLYFCVRVLPLRMALKVPIKISLRMKIDSLRGKIKINAGCVKRGMITLGLTGSDALQALQGHIWIGKGAEICFNGSAQLGAGTSIRVDDNAKLTFGDVFSCNKNCLIRCNKRINFGNRVLIGWNCTFNDFDGHTIIHNDMPLVNRGDIKIGNHVWICSDCLIMKNAVVADECVVSARTVLAKEIPVSHSLIAGMPARIVKNNIVWEL